MHRLLWALQVILGIYFVGIGIVHFLMPAGLPQAMQWMYDLSRPVHYLVGSAEIFGGLGLILPGLTRIQTWLTPLAAAGLALVMVLAAGWHVTRGETAVIPPNLLFATLLSFVAYARWRLRPLAS